MAHNPEPSEGISSILDQKKYRDRRQREEMLRLSQRYTNVNRRSNLIDEKSFKNVLKVESCEQRDLAVDYEAQMEK